MFWPSSPGQEEKFSRKGVRTEVFKTSFCKSVILWPSSPGREEIFSREGVGTEIFKTYFCKSAIFWPSSPEQEDNFSGEGVGTEVFQDFFSQVSQFLTLFFMTGRQFFEGGDRNRGFSRLLFASQSVFDPVLQDRKNNFRGRGRDKGFLDFFSQVSHFWPSSPGQD